MQVCAIRAMLAAVRALISKDSTLKKRNLKLKRKRENHSERKRERERERERERVREREIGERERGAVQGIK